MAAPNANFSGPRYYDELLAPVSFGPFAGALVERIPRNLAGPVLEVACGTGVVTRALRARLPAHCELVATDLSPAMLDYARERHAALPQTTWCVADAMDLPFGDGVFGAVVCGFGFMFPPQPATALAQARRVLAAGGRLFFSVWDAIETNSHALANAQVVEGLFPGDAEMRFRVPYDLHDKARLGAMLAAAGFGDVRMETLRLPIRDADPDAIATGQILGTPRSALLLQRGLDLQEVIARVAAALEAGGGRPYQGQAQGILVQATAA
jgi:SAM-dependent methyltransferase